MKVHQQVVHQILHLAVVVSAQYVAQGDAVLSAQRMVGDKRAQAVVRQVLAAFYFDLGIEKLQACFQKVDSDLVFRFAQEDVQFVLMDDVLQVRDDETGHVL